MDEICLNQFLLKFKYILPGTLTLRRRMLIEITENDTELLTHIINQSLSTLGCKMVQGLD